MKSNTKTQLSSSDITRLLQAAFGPGAQLASMAEVTTGWFNSIYILTLQSPVAGGWQEMVLKVGVERGKYVLRYEQDIMKAEVFICETLAGTEVPVPKILHQDFSHTLLDCDYYFMEKLQGETWADARDKLAPADQQRMEQQLGRYTALLHQIRGPYFGYVKDDPAFQHTTWREAFRFMVNTVIEDGRGRGVNLPYDRVLAALEPLWPLLDAVTEPCLVDFDMWDKNVLVAQGPDGWAIEGIIDFERAFYGDRCAEFISTATICGDIDKAASFQQGYTGVAAVSPFPLTEDDMLRIRMYNVYLFLLMGTEVYRYEEPDITRMLTLCRSTLDAELPALEQAAPR